jgi:S1-C subfamily serine protease
MDWVTCYEQVKHGIAALGISSSPSDFRAIASAFFASSDGTFVTASHALRNEYQWQDVSNRAILVPHIGWPRGLQGLQEGFDVLRFTLVADDPEEDVTVCRPVENPFTSEQTARFVSALDVNTRLDVPPDGTELGICGFAFGTITPFCGRAPIGCLGRYSEQADTRKMERILLHASSWPGMSGSPAFDSEGRVVGVVLGSGKGEASGMVAVNSISKVATLLNSAQPTV